MNTEENTEDEILDQNKKRDDGLAKIAISKEADRALQDILDRVNDDFEAGKAIKQEITSKIIMDFHNDCTDADIHAIRLQFFNPIMLMETNLKKAKETGKVPDSLRQLLYEQFMTSNKLQPTAKRSKKSLKDNAIIDSIENKRDDV